ncbi:transposase [Mesorhizobium sp. M0522]|uniref:transposase n=1 Tax=Mesorhizobium sp. M0522 TaxID=2956958 RepID=UPI00333562A2
MGFAGWRCSWSIRAAKARAEASPCRQGSLSGARMPKPPKNQRKRQGGNQRHCSKRLQPMTITAAGFVMLLTSIPADAMTAEEVLQTCRLRWQVELAFKRLKSGMGIHKLPARDKRLARSWLMAHLILALIIDEAVNDVLDSPPL